MRIHTTKKKKKYSSRSKEKEVDTAVYGRSKRRRRKKNELINHIMFIFCVHVYVNIIASTTSSSI